MQISEEDLNLICAGSGSQISSAIGAGVSIYVGGAMIAEDLLPQVIKATHVYCQIGRALGAWAFEFTHPNVLGQMVFQGGTDNKDVDFLVE